MATIILRIVVLLGGVFVMAFAWAAIRHANDLMRSWPEGNGGENGSSSPGVNRLAYGAMLVAGAQAVGSQAARLAADAPIPWYGAPMILVWEILLIAWFIKRIRYHRKREFKP